MINFANISIVRVLTCPFGDLYSVFAGYGTEDQRVLCDAARMVKLEEAEAFVQYLKAHGRFPASN